MTLTRLGGLAALTCAATYLIGFALLMTLLAPLGYGTQKIDSVAVTGFIIERPAVLLVWNTVIYLVNGAALVILVMALTDRLASLPGWASVTRIFGVIWATLILGAGMIANVAVERTAHLARSDAQAAADLWQVLHAVELGLGGGNEIVGGIWIATVSLAAWHAACLPRALTVLGVLTGIGGMLTLFPAIGDIAGAAFGLWALAWFLAVGFNLLTSPRRVALKS